MLQFAAELRRDRTGQPRPAESEQPRHGGRAAVGQLDRRDIDKPRHAASFQRDAAGSQRLELCPVRLEALVQEERGRSPVRQHQRVMHRVFADAEDADRAVAEFVAVAVGAVEHAATPALGEPFDRWQFVDHAGREHQAIAGVAGVAGFDAEALRKTVRLDGVALVPMYVRISEQLAATFGHDAGGGAPVLAQESVRMLRESISPQAGVDHQNPPPRTCQLQCCGEARVAAADHDGIEMPGHPRVSVHGRGSSSGGCAGDG